MKRIRVQKPQPRRERPANEVLPPGWRDPDIVRAKARARTPVTKWQVSSVPGQALVPHWEIAMMHPSITPALGQARFAELHRQALRAALARAVGQARRAPKQQSGIPDVGSWPQSPAGLAAPAAPESS